ncbi:hypothetical protein GCM10010347_38810 [Streptomyces cirratus]|uniref:Uncharacterized protein n=1 Tax=Streptomyces cirratus TaxID=68187 RepID=A0ABQ3EZL6_9ACTN|nr:hypothetical protein GCM10010347_38810 [Streptomyces cirratus]
MIDDLQTHNFLQDLNCRQLPGFDLRPAKTAAMCGPHPKGYALGGPSRVRRGTPGAPAPVLRAAQGPSTLD